MSPEEWAGKIRDLIEEAEEDLTWINDREWWAVDVDGETPSGICMKHYVQGFEVKSDRIYIF